MSYEALENMSETVWNRVTSNRVTLYKLRGVNSCNDDFDDEGGGGGSGIASTFRYSKLFETQSPGRSPG